MWVEGRRRGVPHLTVDAMRHVMGGQSAICTTVSVPFTQRGRHQGAGMDIVLKDSLRCTLQPGNFHVKTMAIRQPGLSVCWGRVIKKSMSSKC